jgi:uncharacterized membrane protein
MRVRGRRGQPARRPRNRDGQRGRLARMNFDQVARGLGWLSLGLGLAEVLMPKRIQRMLGVCGDYSNPIRMAGARELGHALMIFMQARPHQGVWTRVAGDAMDLAMVGAAFTTPCPDTGRLTAATAALAGVTALDALTATQLGGRRSQERAFSTLTRAELNHRTRSGAFHVTKSVTINRAPDVLYQYWHNFANLPQFMYHLKSVTVDDNGRSHWVAKAPAGTEVAWDAEITDDRPNELIAWRSLPDADVPNSGLVRFERGAAGRGTVVRVEIEYRPPGGAIGKAVATLFGEEPGQQVAGDLMRFKQVMETGEVVRSEGAPRGYGQKAQPPARPQGPTNGEHRETQAEPRSQETTL